MKKVIVILASVLVTTSVQAQLKDIMRNKAGGLLGGKKSGTTQTTTSTDSTKTQTNTDAANSNTQSGTNQSTNSAGWGGFSMGSKSDIANEYTFAHNMHIEIESIKKGATSGDKNNMIMYIGKDNSNLSGMEMKTDPKKPNDKMISVYEYSKDQAVTYMHSNDKKNVMVSKYKYTQVDTAKASKGPVFTKTGRTKTILTYKCEEWVGTDEKGNKYETWMTTAVNIPVNEYLRKNSEAQKSRGGSQVDYNNMPKGFMMEMTSIAKDGDKVIWKVTAINMNTTFTVKTSEYEYVGY